MSDLGSINSTSHATFVDDGSDENILKIEIIRRSTLNLWTWVLLGSALWLLWAPIQVPYLFSGGHGLWSSVITNATSPNQLHLTAGSIIRFFIFVNGITYSVCSIILFFLLVAFPYRILYRRIVLKGTIVTQQVAFIPVLILLSCSPTFTAYWGVLEYWQNYRSYVNFYDALAPTMPNSTWASQFESLIFSVYIFDATDDPYATYGFALMMILMFWHVLITIYRENTRAICPIDKSTSYTTNTSHVPDEEANVSGDGCFIKTWHSIKHRVSSCYHSIKDLGCCQCTCYYCCCCCCCCSREQCNSRSSLIGTFRRGFDLRFLCLIMFYYSFVSISSGALDFYPSMMPFVSILTILRVCCSRDERGHSYCDSKEYYTSFVRAMFVLCYFFLEILISWMFVRRRKSTVASLKSVSYSSNRSNYLGYAVTQGCSMYVFYVIIGLSILMVLIPPLEFWTVSLNVSFSRGMIENFTTVDSWIGNVTDYSVNPLWQIGITQLNPGFFYIFFIISIWLLVLGYVHLPADSTGWVGWFASVDATSRCHCFGYNKRVDVLEQPDYYVSEEVALMQLQRRASKLSQQLPSSSHFNTIKSTLTRGTIGVLQDPEDVMQVIQSNSFVFENELLMLNFSQVAYKMCEDSVMKPGVTKQSLIEDRRYMLLGHITDSDTDTNVIIARSEDRIVIAFRGTVSATNMKTDIRINMREIPFDIEHEFFRTDTQEFDPAKAMMKRALDKLPVGYHSGFLKAYLSVSKRIHELIDHLLIGYDTQQLPLFVTGHSLGGGLACICAYDFGIMILGKTSCRPSISTTTFGCPRVGSLSFQRKFRALIPTAKRFVLKGDPITKTPPNLWKCGSFRGYHHVGLEMLLDLEGNVMISPSEIEKRLVHGINVLSRAMHFLSRYTLSFILLSARMEGSSFDPPIWPIVINHMLRYSVKHMKRVNKELLDDAYHVILKEGVIYGKYRTVGTTMLDEDDEFDIELQERMSMLDNDDSPHQGSFPDTDQDVNLVKADLDIDAVLKNALEKHIIDATQLERIQQLLKPDIEEDCTKNVP